MTLNRDQLVQDLIRDEGLVLKPYRCTAGKLTIGVGRNLEDVGLSRDEAIYLLGNDIETAIKDLDAALPQWRLFSEARQRALVNMVLNLGRTRFMGFRNMIDALKRADFDEAARQALASKWASQVGARAQRIAKMIREG